MALIIICIVSVVVVLGIAAFELVGWLVERKARALREDDSRRALQVPERNAQKAALALSPRDLQPPRLRRRDARVGM